MSEKPDLAPSFWRSLARENPLGIEINEQDARDWFDLVWPRYRDRGYVRHRRAIASWWSRLTLGELERARARGKRLRQGRPGLCPFPRRLSPEQRAQLLAFAKKLGFSRGQLTHAVQVVRRWARKNERASLDWCAEIELAMLRGWALDGYDRDRRPGSSAEMPQDPGWRDNTLSTLKEQLGLRLVK